MVKEYTEIVYKIVVDDSEYQKLLALQKKDPFYQGFQQKGGERYNKGVRQRTFEMKKYNEATGQTIAANQKLESHFKRVSTVVKPKVGGTGGRGAAPFGNIPPGVSGFFNQIAPTQNAVSRSLVRASSSIKSDLEGKFKSPQRISRRIPAGMWDTMKALPGQPFGTKGRLPPVPPAAISDLAGRYLSPQRISRRRPASIWDTMKPLPGQPFGTQTNAPLPRSIGFLPRLNRTLQGSDGWLRRINKNFFMLQMATLGVAFSFMGLTKSFEGIFQTLADIGGVFKGKALGKAFGGVDVAGGMGVSGGQLVQGWKDFQGITGMIQTAMASIAALTLSPEVMDAIKSMFIELSKALADPKVVTAMQQLVIAFTDFIKTIIPVLPVIANLITLLGETGLLKVIVGVAMAAGVLLPIMSLIGGTIQSIVFIANVLIPALMTVISFLEMFSAILGIGLGSTIALVIGVIAGVLIIFDALIRVIVELWTNGISLTSVVNGLIKAFNDVYNVVVTIMNGISSVLGMGNLFKTDVPLQWLWGGGSSGTSSSTNTTVNNYNFNGTYDDPSRNIRNTQKSKNTSPY